MFARGAGLTADPAISQVTAQASRLVELLTCPAYVAECTRLITACGAEPRSICDAVIRGLLGEANLLALAANSLSGPFSFPSPTTIAHQRLSP